MEVGDLVLELEVGDLEAGLEVGLEVELEAGLEGEVWEAADFPGV